MTVKELLARLKEIEKEYYSVAEEYAKLAPDTPIQPFEDQKILIDLFDLVEDKNNPGIKVSGYLGIGDANVPVFDPTLGIVFSAWWK